MPQRYTADCISTILQKGSLTLRTQSGTKCYCMSAPQRENSTAVRELLQYDGHQRQDAPYSCHQDHEGVQLVLHLQL